MALACSLKGSSENHSMLKLLLANLNLKFTVIGISETWLQKDSHDVDMIGYEFIHKNRPDRAGRVVKQF